MKTITSIEYVKEIHGNVHITFNKITYNIPIRAKVNMLKVNTIDSVGAYEEYLLKNYKFNHQKHTKLVQEIVKHLHDSF